LVKITKLVPIAEIDELRQQIQRVQIGLIFILWMQEDAVKGVGRNGSLGLSQHQQPQLFARIFVNQTEINLRLNHPFQTMH